MSDLKTCPRCGAPLSAETAEGLCRACLLKLGLEGNSLPSTAAPMLAGWTPPEPAELKSRFPDLEILQLIGRGGMGAVYKARQKKLDRLVAVKILPPGIGADPAFADRFAREAQALARLRHPSIVTIHEFGQTEGLFFFVMEYVDGVNLRQLLNAGRMAPREALAIVPQICDALQYAHDHGIVHRDIKPENILLDRRGHVTVADFGLAKIVGRETSALSAAGQSESPSAPGTEAGQVVGTPHYMAPEQVAHPAEVDHRADIYSLGVVFYQMLTGELPGKHLQAPSTKVVIDVRLDEIVLRALEQDPQRRYQQVSEVKTRIMETMTGSSPPAQDAPLKALQAPLKISSRAYFTTPQHLATFFGGFWWPRIAGELALYDDRLLFSRGWERTEIPFASLKDVGLARCPRWMSPARHQFLSVSYDEGGQRKTLLFMPGPAWFRTAEDTRQQAAEWIVAIRETVKAATGKDVPGDIREPAVVPASPWGTLAVLAPLLLIAVFLIWQFVALRGSAAPIHPTLPPQAPQQAPLPAAQEKLNHPAEGEKRNGDTG
ncbi:MAG: serine/threonine protein kinase [Planctomycetia bacterium]|nr:serine/threonine protein kinase [Planctomycetia bacterium]